MNNDMDYACDTCDITLEEKETVFLRNKSYCKSCDNGDIALSRVDNVELDGIDTNDYPDFSDAYVTNATWKHNDEYLTDVELDELNDVCSDDIHQLVLEVVL